MRYLISLLVLFALPAFGAGDPDIADLESSWDAVTTDDTGAALPGVVDEYRLYDCSGTLLATVPGDQTSHVEADAVPGTGTHCREVAAFVSPFEGDKAQANLAVVMPGSPGNLQLQALDE